jgi:hypothetical protein
VARAGFGGGAGWWRGGSRDGAGEPADESFVDVRDPGVGEVVAQVIKVGPGLIGADRLAGCLGEGQGLVPGGYP